MIISPCAYATYTSDFPAKSSLPSLKNQNHVMSISSTHQCSRWLPKNHPKLPWKSSEHVRPETKTSRDAAPRDEDATAHHKAQGWIPITSEISGPAQISGEIQSWEKKWIGEHSIVGEHHFNPTFKSLNSWWTSFKHPTIFVVSHFRFNPRFFVGPSGNNRWKKTKKTHLQSPRSSSPGEENCFPPVRGKNWAGCFFPKNAVTRKFGGLSNKHGEFMEVVDTRWYEYVFSGVFYFAGKCSCLSWAKKLKLQDFTSKVKAIKTKWFLKSSI